MHASTRLSMDCEPVLRCRHPRVRIPLKGEWKGYWECHIASNWLLIYKLTDDEVLLARTGTHADLFAR